MADILNNIGEPIFDDHIIKIETMTNANEHSDKIHIFMQQQNLYTLSCDSFLYIEGRLIMKKKNN